MEDILNIRATKYYEKLNTITAAHNYVKFSNCTSLEVYKWKTSLGETMTKLAKLKLNIPKNDSVIGGITQNTISQRSYGTN